MKNSVLCSQCFNDQGLRLDAERIGVQIDSGCPNCSSKAGYKLDETRVEKLAYRFFVWGTLNRLDFGGAPAVQFNEQRTTEIEVSEWLKKDVQLIGELLGIGFFYYGPRTWMVGEVEPLKDLQHSDSRQLIINRILNEYPDARLKPDELFYRVRLNIENFSESNEYDSAPIDYAGTGRLDSKKFPVMYASKDLAVCVHECRVIAEDQLYVATLSPTCDLRLLDLSELIDDGETEFESLDMAVHMLFLAAKHSYEISRDIALAVHAAGFDGLMYPSYFSLLRTGSVPFETAYGMSYRKLEQLQDYTCSKIVPNIALFGRPIEDKKVEIRCINKVILGYVEYGFHFGPVTY